MTHKLFIFISGEGTNLQAIIDAINNGILDAKIIGVLCNKRDAYGLVRARENSIMTYYKPFISKKQYRTDYDKELADFINKFDHDLIVLAGWMHILGKDFLSRVKTDIINLHPALPGQFPGIDAVKYAYNSFQEGKVKGTGIMVHHVVEKIDAGKVINMIDIPIFMNDTEDSLRRRIRYFEKPLLINGIQKYFAEYDLTNNANINIKKLIYSGKVREIYDIGDDKLLIVATNRQSAFDRHICDIDGKGILLTNISAWWFNLTKDIIDNHYIDHSGREMVVKKCKPYKVEVVVRGYMTGSTNTSLWTYYNKGCREYCGHHFEDGIKKNQKLVKNIVTPTTKDISDKPISGQEVINLGLMLEDEWKYMEEIALKLFEYGQKIANNKGLILVDTKYEFGKDKNGKIILIDELHTCDSSRYWLLSSYQSRFDQGLEPEKFDKDVVREWIKTQCDPYNDPLPEIPDELIKKTYNSYIKFGKMLLN